MVDPRELRALAKRCEDVGDLPGHLRPAELQLIDRAIRELGLIEEQRSFRFYTRDLSSIKLLVPDGHKWSLFSDGWAGCANEPGEEIPAAHIEAQTPELALLAAVLYALAALLEGSADD